MRLEVKDLKFNYKNHLVLDKVNFSINEGSLTCILGANGAGKTTLFRCILQFLTHYEGEILLDHINIKAISDQERAKKIAYIPQSHQSMFNYQVEEVVLMATQGESGAYMPGKKERQLVYESLEKVGIMDLAARGYAEISGGERQLVLLARALAQKAKILVMDEPTSSLDYGNQIRILELITQLAKDGYTILQSTHHPDQALHYAKQVLILEKGRILASGLPQDVITGEVLSQVYRLPIEVLASECQKGWVCIPASRVG